MDGKDRTSETLDPFRMVTRCDKCPCCNGDYEDGDSCNLEYNLSFYWTPDGKLISGSEECGLSFVEYTDGVYHPEEIEARKGRTDGR